MVEDRVADRFGDLPVHDRGPRRWQLVDNRRGAPPPSANQWSDCAKTRREITCGRFNDPQVTLDHVGEARPPPGATSPLTVSEYSAFGWYCSVGSS